MTRPRIAVVGTGWWAAAHHIPSLAGYEGADLVALCDPARARAEELAARHAVPAVYADLDQLLHVGGVDAVVIATPHSTHHRLARAALDAGLHVLVEKTMTTTAADAFDLVVAAEKAGLHLSVGYTYQHAATAELARAAVQHEIGDLAQVVAEFAARVTKLLQSVTDDLHLRVIHHPDGAPDLEDDDVYEARWRDQAAVTAGGVRRVERVAGNIAVVEFGPVIGLPAHAGNWLTAAMSLCRGADAVVLDLRECVGGTPDGVALICSYLLGPVPVHLTDILDRHGRRQFWTAALVPGDRLSATCPIAVLVSQRTFSGGEDLAFTLQELGRATVIGATTRGGAHPRIGVRVHDQLELALPIARPISPRSGGNWEGIGVQPDIPCDPERAFERAVELLRTE